MAVVLNVEHLQKSYRKKIILKDINFQIHDSSILALIGANGAGKTTLINTILKLIPKDTGEIQFSADKWKQITGVMMQDNLILDRINVKEILNLTRSYFQNPLSYENLIGISGLKEVENTFVSQLSGGQKRRLSFALALAAAQNPLTNQELKILKEFSQGKGTQEIADTVFLSYGTVRNYISSILSKTGTHSRIEALNIAKKNNWI